MKQKLYLFLLALSCQFMSFAQQITDLNGINYITSAGTATVMPGQCYTGALVLTSVVFDVADIGFTTPYTLTNIEANAFSFCGSLTSVDIPNSITSIGANAFTGCEGLTSVSIGNSVTTIGDYAFIGCINLTSINIPNSVTTIGTGAFRACTSATTLIISNALTTIENEVFYGCSNLTSVDIPNSVTSIGTFAFRDCTNLVSVDIPNSVTSIGQDAFLNCSNLTSVDIPNSVTSIGIYAFDNCTSLITVNIPNSVTTFGYGVFNGCSSLTSIDIPNSVTSIGALAFQNCTSLTAVNIPNSVTAIYDQAFNSCTSLTTIDIPNSVTTIGSLAFRDCTNLVSVNIPNSVTSIEDYAFYDCPSLTSVTCAIPSPLVILVSVFGGTTNQGACTLYVPSASVSTYQTTAVWEDFMPIQAIPTPATHLNFDGVDDYVSLNPAAINNLTEGSISALIYLNSLDNQTICAKQSNFENSYAIFTVGGVSAANGQIFFGPRNGVSITSTTILNTSQWYHITVTFNTTNANIYIDGVLDRTVTGDFSIPNDLTVTATSIGAWLGDGGGQYFNGNIDEFRVWNLALSLANIQAITNCELQSAETRLVTYYKFNQGFGSSTNTGVNTLTNAVSGGTNGMLTNFALTGTTSNWLAGSAIVTGTNCAVLSSSSFNVSENINVYPNPTNGTINIQVDNLTNVSVSVYDLNGRQILNKDLSANENTVDISNFQTGMYLFRIKSSEGEIVKKVIKK